MKTDIHPEYFPKAKISCACGTTYEVGSTMPEISIELCAACHPFYTGTQKIVDAARRVEKFHTRAKAVKTTATGKKVKSQKRAAQKAAKATDDKKTA